MHANEALAMVSATPVAGRIGPNAITRVAEALTAHGGNALTASVFARAGLARYLDTPPEAMVDEAEVARLHRALAARLQRADGVAIARDAGRRTADYLLARRIPRPAQWLLRLLPRRLAAGILVDAIAKHAWTFAGSGEFSHAFDHADARVLWLNIVKSPLCRHADTPAPACDYFAATFQGVFGAMLGRNVRVVEIECSAGGAPACRFRVSW
jgi:divinyl protochlorophyllide a 8-vinyl-reductase